MGDKTAIEWTDATWNPVRGCSIVSKGCTNCYAMKMAHRSSGAGGAYEGLTKLTKGGPVWTGEVRTLPELLDLPFHWRRPRRIFVNSMSDLFHESVPIEFIDRVFSVMARADRHVYQVLTKRPQRMLEYLTDTRQERPLLYLPRPRPNIWLGVSVEDQASADERIPLLLQTPAAVRWISAEPLLGPVDLHRTVANLVDRADTLQVSWRTALHFAGVRIHWVVVGGESGPGARAMHPSWARSLRDQCAAAHVAFFFKQWGSWAPCVDFPRHAAGDELKHIVPSRMGPANGREQDFETMVRLPKKIAGRQLDGRTHDEYPA